MKRPRVRISTLMFLVVIAALVVALVVEKRRSAKLMAEAEALAANERQATAAALSMQRTATLFAEQVTNANASKSKEEASKATSP